MSESTLSVNRDEILQAVGDYFTFGRDRWVWNREQTAQVTRVVRSGERTFYNPPGHTWSFLTLKLALSITNAATDFTLPDDFGGLLDSYLSFSAGNNEYQTVKVTSVAEIMRRRQFTNVDAQIQPILCAVNAKSSDGTSTGQRFELLLYPQPTVSGTLNGRYYSDPYATSDSSIYPLGGQPHAETLLTCCLAAAELEKIGQPGPQAAKYAERLSTSIAMDRRMGAKWLGYNGDGSCDERWSVYDMRSGAPTYNGVALS